MEQPEAWFHDQLLRRRERLGAVPQPEQREEFRALIREVDTALDRLERGKFGDCERCHDPIEIRRLVGDPSTRVCLGCLTEAQQRALEQDLELAAVAQRALLPEETVRTVDWEIAHRYHPLGAVSGDYCDVLRSEEVTWFILGDVSGKGIAASILMGHLQAVFRSLAAATPDPSELAGRANRILCEGVLAGSYSTLLLGRLLPDGSVEICNAGHERPLLARAGRVRSLRATGLPIGMFRESTYEVERFQMQQGENLLLYTDGLTDALDDAGETYGTERAQAFARELNGEAPAEVLERWFAELRGFQGNATRQDDLTLMMVRRRK